ncbi:hypothetical protein bpr_II175 (plasmid) [Butyrivibrio proteoclasticus B316]|uniref:Uncharacterized protein n=1 Tax=Butyrivibrio proteoclasticus (strain ATCC 51982 / DSM 14932 / B316) TaxID=515622 RepID=E0S3Y1_BUTPB|nr:hypothetical protein [Butyrivibrio proteoclasticus]ADL36113.1 hypothetical protein bpr_II175 [Butyrivibrio proteoclasticus B316]
MKNEAIRRMESLKIREDVIADYKETGKIWCSDKDKITDVPEDILREINRWEAQFGNLVYHVIRGYFGYSTYECLSVSRYKEDWGYERELIDDSWVMSYSINMDRPCYTESGSIKVENKDGVLMRIN